MDCQEHGANKRYLSSGALRAIAVGLVILGSASPAFARGSSRLHGSVACVTCAIGHAARPGIDWLRAHVTGHKAKPPPAGAAPAAGS